MKTYSYPRHHLLSLTVSLSILAALILTGCSSGSTQAPLPTDTPKPIPTSVPPTKTPKPIPTSVPPAITPNSIQNIIWQWVSVTNQTTNVVTTVPSPASYTISFYPDGTLSGKADCNTFNGTYSQQNGFTIKLGASTMAFCGDASLDGQYLDLLGKVAAGGPDGAGGLALETAGGEQRMLFKNGGPTVKP
jgi:heat shock protein HslJ